MNIENRPYINGNYLNIKSLKKIIKISPTNKKKLPPISICKKSEIDLAVFTAQKAFESKIWLKKTSFQRLRLASQYSKKNEVLSLIKLTNRISKLF